MTSVTASSSLNMDMISRLMLAGQVKLVKATSLEFNDFATQTVPSIAIPALTGSQIAIVYLEITGSSSSANYSPSASMTAAGTGLSVSVNMSVFFTGSTNVPPQGQIFKNSAFGTTTTGSQTVSFSALAVYNGSTVTRYTAQAAVFIYSPPF